MTKLNTCVVVLNWNNGSDTIDCLESLLDRDDLPCSVVICDNASIDNSVLQICNWLSKKNISFTELIVDDGLFSFGQLRNIEYPPVFPTIALIHTGGNLGYAGGNNVGIRYALSAISFETLLVLNNDTVVTQGALRAMHSRMAADSRCGICGPKLVYFHSMDLVQAWGGARYLPLLGSAHHLGANCLVSDKPDPHLVESRTDYICGAAMMVSRQFLEDVGLMNEDYFLYYEEIDWATRGRKKGYSFGYASEAIILHKEGASIGSSRDKKKRSMLSEYYLLSSRLKFTRRFHPWFLPTVFCFSLFQIARVLARGDLLRCRTMLRAIVGVPYAR